MIFSNTNWRIWRVILTRLIIFIFNNVCILQNTIIHGGWIYVHDNRTFVRDQPLIVTKNWLHITNEWRRHESPRRRVKKNKRWIKDVRNFTQINHDCGGKLLYLYWTGVCQILKQTLCLTSKDAWSITFINSVVQYKKFTNTKLTCSIAVLKRCINLFNKSVFFFFLLIFFIFNLFDARQSDDSIDWRDLIFHIM